MVTSSSRWAEPALASDRADAEAWAIAAIAASLSAPLARARGAATFAWTSEGLTQTDADDASAVLDWRWPSGWHLRIPEGDPRHGVLDLWLPICNAHPERPVAVGHLGQSIDGFIATQSGDSQFVTGHQNILHLHRLRAICSAVIVGAGTVAFDDPLLTTRHVPGPNPLRVIFDPARRLVEADYRLFTDETAHTVYACSRACLREGETSIGRAPVIPLDAEAQGPAAAELIRHLRDRGCFRLFVEGGGVTVSAFLEANLLDRLQIAIAPVIIGNGRPAIRLPARQALRDCTRPDYRVFRMGGDVLFDCDLRAGADPAAAQASTTKRVI